MSKVLVDRELLRDCSAELSDWRMSFPDADSGMTDRLVGEIDAILAQPAEAEGVSNARLMNTLAELARRAPLRTLQTICETQHQVSTVKLERYLEPIGDTLAGYAFTLRIDFDKLIAALSAVTAERDRLREEMAELWKRIDKFQSQSHGITALAEIERLRAEVEMLRALLGKSLPVVEAHAGASHMLDGFRPARNKWDDLVDGIRAAMAAKEA